MLLSENSRNSIFGIECLRVDILVVNIPLDIDINAAGLYHVGQDGVTVKDYLGLEGVGGHGDDSVLHLDCDCNKTTF